MAARSKARQERQPILPSARGIPSIQVPTGGYFCAQVAAGSRDGAWSRALRTWRHRVIHVFTCPSSSLCSASLSFAPHRLQPEKLFLCLAHGASFHSRRPPSGCVAAHKNPRGAIRITEGAAWKAQLGGALPSPLPFPPGAMHAAGAVSCPSQLCPWGAAS